MRRWYGKAGSLTLAVALLLGIAAPVLAATPAAQPAPAPAEQSGQGLELSPPVLELAADPGQTVQATISVRNVTKGVLIAKGRADDFGAGSNEDGQPKLLLEETGATRYSLKYWVQGVPDLRLAPGELKKNVVNIVVPKNAEPGGHFGVIRFTAVPPDLEGTGVALSASIGTLVLLKVSGTISEKLSLAEFSSNTSKKSTEGKPTEYHKTSFFETGPVDFVVRLRNEGNVHEKVKGNIEVKDWLGKTATLLTVNPNGGNVLPDSVRRFEQSFKDKRLFGRYTAVVKLTYANDKTLTATTSFWVIPWKLILLVVLGLVVLAIVLRLAIKRYNEYIIAQASRRR